MLNIKQAFSIIILVPLICGCAREPVSEKETAFQSLIASSNINDMISLSYLDFMDTGKIGDVVDLRVFNNSNKEILFPFDWGAKIYFYQETEQQWIEIVDKGIVASTNVSFVQSEHKVVKTSKMCIF